MLQTLQRSTCDKRNKYMFAESWNLNYRVMENVPTFLLVTQEIPKNNLTVSNYFSCYTAGTEFEHNNLAHLNHLPFQGYFQHCAVVWWRLVLQKAQIPNFYCCASKPKIASVFWYVVKDKSNLDWNSAQMCGSFSTLFSISTLFGMFWL